MIRKEIALAHQQVQTLHRQDAVLVNIGLGKWSADLVLIANSVKLQAIDWRGEVDNHSPGAIDATAGGTRANEIGRRALVLRLGGDVDNFSVCR